MYLLSRRAKLASAASAEWAMAITGAAGEAIGNEVQLWATTMSPGLGTVSWTSWWADLASLEAGMAKLESHAGYLELAAQGPDHLDGPIDDGLIQLIGGAPDPDREVNYVSGVQAVCGAGQLAQAMAAGVEIAERATAITGVPTLFGRSMTGAYGGIGWLSGYADLAAYGTAMDALAADADWVKYLDSLDGCFVEDPAVTQATLYRKVG